MNVKEQASYAKKWVDLVAQHDDEDLVVRVAMIDDLITHATAAKEAATARAQARVAELLAGPDVEG